MSQNIPLFAQVALAPNNVQITALGMLDITLFQPTNGFVITDINLVPQNLGSGGGGVIVQTTQIGVAPPSLAQFSPFATFQYINASSATSVVFSYGAFQRSFGSGLILPAGYTRLVANTTRFTNITAMNFTLDISGFYY